MEILREREREREVRTTERTNASISRSGGADCFNTGNVATATAVSIMNE
jgi:hypothetical protein